MIKIAIDGIVGETPNRAADVRAAIRPGGPVEVAINSPGGDASEGLAIYNVLRAHAGRVRVVVDSVAASAASLIAMAGDDIEMRAGSLIMIHDPSAITVGTAADHEKSAAVLSKMAEQFASIYAARSGLAEERVRQMMIEETWMDAETAVRSGFATEASVEAVSAHIAAFLSHLNRFTNLPAALVTAMATENPTMTTKTESSAAAPAAQPTPPAPAPADATADILARCATAKMSAEEAQTIIAKAKGDATAARDLIIDAVAAKNGAAERVVVGGDAGGDPEGHAKAMSDAFLAKLQGKSAVGPFAGMSTVGLAGEWLRARGIRPVSNDATSVVRQALSARQTFMSGPGFVTTSDLPVILGDSMQRSLAALFTAADSGVSQVVGTGTMPDFREKTLGKLSSFPALKAIAESSEFTWGTLDEAGEKISVGTFGRAIAVSLQVMVNDNLGAVQRSLRDVAFAAVNLKATLILDATLSAKMSDGYALFDATHHLNDGDYGPLGVTALDAIRAKMRLQKALDRTTVLGLTPAVLLVPAAQETVAQQLAASITPNQSESVNPFSGIKIAVEPRLDAIDPSAHYVFADPAVMPAVEFDTLEATPAPRLEIADPASFDRLGSAYRVWWACGASPIEWRAAVRNSGSTS